jgi:hypothetical protein
MDYIKNLKELKGSGTVTHDPLMERARINDPRNFTYDVYVYGGDSNGKGRNEHGDPHFHFSDNINGGDWQFSVLIPTVSEWNANKELYISESSTGQFNWHGYKKEKKSLIEWLDHKNRLDPDKTNLEFIRQTWNLLNTDNKNVAQIKHIK